MSTFTQNIVYPSKRDRAHAALLVPNLRDETLIKWRYFHSRNTRYGLPFVREAVMPLNDREEPPVLIGTRLVLAFARMTPDPEYPRRAHRIFYIEDYDGIANAGRPPSDAVAPVTIFENYHAYKLPHCSKPMLTKTRRRLAELFERLRAEEAARAAK